MAVSDAHNHRIHARERHRGRDYNYSWVMVESAVVADPWFGKLALLFAARRAGMGNRPWENFALLWYLGEVHPHRAHVREARHFQYYGVQPEVVELTSILQPCGLLRSPLEHNHLPVFLALPYGATHDSTQVGGAEGEGGDGEEGE